MGQQKVWRPGLRPQYQFDCWCFLWCWQYINLSHVPKITQRVFVVTPTYFLINSCFVDVGLDDRLTAIEETHNGKYSIDLVYLEQQLQKYSQDLEPVHDDINVFPDPVRGTRKYYRFVMYLVPTFSNPGGLNYTLETRQKLVEIARKYDLLLISDDVYEFLDYTDSSRCLD